VPALHILPLFLPPCQRWYWCWRMQACWLDWLARQGALGAKCRCFYDFEALLSCHAREVAWCVKRCWNLYPGRAEGVGPAGAANISRIRECQDVRPASSKRILGTLTVLLHSEVHTTVTTGHVTGQAASQGCKRRPHNVGRLSSPWRECLQDLPCREESMG